MIPIDDGFIRYWEAKYDEIENDENTYQQIILQVKKEVHKSQTLSRSTTEEIYNWKFPLAKRSVEWREFAKYEDGFRRALQATEEQKIAILDDLPGIGISLASTFLHFMYPKSFPIIDVRTVDTLQHFGYLDKSKSLYRFRDTAAGYGIFRGVIASIVRQNPIWTIRQVDRALFAYHKIILKPTGKKCRHAAS